MAVAARLKQLVNDKGVTYSFIALKTGIPVDAISKSLLGKRRLPADELVDICNVVGIELNELQPAHTAPAQPDTGQTQAQQESA